MLDKFENNIPTLIVLIAVLIAIALLPKYKNNLRKLNNNLLGLIIGFIGVIIFLLIDQIFATLLLFVLIVFYYTNVKQETLETFNDPVVVCDAVNKFDEKMDKIALNMLKVSDVINRDSLNINCDALGCRDDFQNTNSRISEGFVRDKVPEVYRKSDKKEGFTTNLNETFKNHLENNDIQDLKTQEEIYKTFQKNQYDVVGCRYDGKKELNNEFETIYGKPLADDTNYQETNTRGPFYPLNR